MNWKGISENSRQKIDSLVNAFDEFINNNHMDGAAEDQRILKEWQLFHKLIQQAPADTDSHYKHVNELRNTLLKE